MEKARTILKHYFISGRVQGVGFRAFTHRTAVAMKLVGWVRNLADGRVEVTVGGPADQIVVFEARLREGPPSARVDQVEVGEGAGDFREFELRRDG